MKSTIVNKYCAYLIGNSYMTSGRVTIELADTKIDAIFKDGKIVGGRYSIGDTSYSGIFNENGKLNSFGEMVYKGSMYKGTFVNGSFVEGEEFSNGRLISKGTYVHDADRPRLVEGVKYDNNMMRRGKFSVYGNLTHGSVKYTNGTCMVGAWYNNNSMIEGTITNHLLGFIAEYKIRRVDNRDLLSHCQVKFNGDPATLPKEMLLLLACRGNNCTALHNLYNEHMNLVQGSGMTYLLRDKDEIRMKLEHSIALFDEMISNISTPAVPEKDIDIDPMDYELFTTYYRSHD